VLKFKSDEMRSVCILLGAGRSMAYTGYILPKLDPISANKVGDHKRWKMGERVKAISGQMNAWKYARRGTETLKMESKLKVEQPDCRETFLDLMEGAKGIDYADEAKNEAEEKER
jgi:hypothetical protein